MLCSRASVLSDLVARSPLMVLSFTFSSLSLSGALKSVGSLLFYGALLGLGSLPRCGALYSSGSLASHGALLGHGSLRYRDAIGAPSARSRPLVLSQLQGSLAFQGTLVSPG